MSLQRYWTSFKESFLGTITSLTLKKPAVVEEEDEIQAIKNGFAEHNEKNGVAKEEDVVNGQNGHNGHSQEPPLIIDQPQETQVNNNTSQKKEEETVQSKPDQVEKDGDSSSDEEEVEKVAAAATENRSTGEDDEELEESSDEEEAVVGNLHEIERLHAEAKTCQKCKNTFESAGEASKCLNSHKRVRCYFCFSLYKNTEKLFEHFSKKHIQAGRDKFLVCPYCDLSVPFKSVSCHVISSHLMDRPSKGHGSPARSAPTPPSAPTSSRRSARGHPPPSEPPPPSKRAKQNDGIYWVD